MCVFCDIATKDPKKQVVTSFTPEELLGTVGVVVIEPLSPAVKGHLLFIPDKHIMAIGDEDNDKIIASTYAAVNIFLRENPGPCNIITNNGADADQTVFHLHVHLIPRVPGDNVELPWTYQKRDDHDLPLS